MLNKFGKYLGLAAASAALAACGGGGNSSTSTTSVSTGYFIDAAVEGLGFSTPTQSGVTGADGSFKYIENENITFNLYGKPLFSAKGFTYLTPFDLSDTSVNPGYSINLIRFLMALDVDSNPSNGLKLPAYAGSLDVDFNKSILDFQADTDGKIAAFLNAQAAGRPLATVEAAVTHFNDSLANISPSYSLSLAGKSATSTIKNSNCTNNATTGWQYSFGATSAQVVGSDGFQNSGDGNCTPNDSETLNMTYVDFVAGEFLSCAPTCTYKGLNRVAYLNPDVDGRTAVEWSWHSPNSNKIYYAKTILADPDNNNNPIALSTFTEVITLN